MTRSAERSAARLAHQSGGLGAPSSNLGAPTNKIKYLASGRRRGGLGGNFFFINGFGRWITFQLGQLCEEQTGPSFDRLSRLDQDRMSTCGHCGHFGFSRTGFIDDRFCQRANTINDLLRIKAALTGELLPVPPLEVVAPALAVDLLREI